MAARVIRIFPHSREEFADADDLRTWLLTALKAKGGRYLLHASQGSIPPGSIVLFRHGNEVVGEAVVKQAFTAQLTKEGDFTYKGFIKFVPSSIRVYVGSLSIATLEKLAGRDFSVARTYFRIDDWALYAGILAEVAEEGFYC